MLSWFKIIQLSQNNEIPYIKKAKILELQCKNIKT